MVQRGDKKDNSLAVTYRARVRIVIDAGNERPQGALRRLVWQCLLQMQVLPHAVGSQGELLYHCELSSSSVKQE